VLPKPLSGAHNREAAPGDGDNADVAGRDKSPGPIDEFS